MWLLYHVVVHHVEQVIMQVLFIIILREKGTVQKPTNLEISLQSKDFLHSTKWEAVFYCYYCKQF